MTVAMQQGGAVAAAIGFGWRRAVSTRIGERGVGGRAAWGSSRASLSPTLRLDSVIAAALLVAAALIVLERAFRMRTAWRFFLPR